MRKNHLSCIFFGKKNDQDSKNAYNYLKKYFVKVVPVLTDNIIGEKIKFQNYLGFDYFFSFRTKLIIPKYFINKTKNFGINFHTALPKYPGSGGTAWSIINNDKYAGITVHLVNEKVDNGKIIFIKKFLIPKEIDISNLLKITYKNQLKTFFYVIKNLFKKNWIEKSMEKNKKIIWNGKAKKISRLNKIRNIKINISKNKLARIIRASNFGKYKPFLRLHGKRFYLK